MNEAIEIMEQRNVKPTSNRILVLNALLKASAPVSLGDLEIIIETMDKSSIFRVLNLFLEHDIVHGIEDGSGSLKYEVCHGSDHCSIEDMHVHFFCVSCQKTFCFKQTQIPQVQLPENFIPHSINYMVKGLCPSCSAKGW